MLRRLITAAALTGLALPAQAVLVTYEFSFEVGTPAGPIAGPPGRIVEGSFTVDTDDTTTGVVDFFGGVTYPLVSFEVDGTSFTDPEITLFNDVMNPLSMTATDSFVVSDGTDLAVSFIAEDTSVFDGIGLDQTGALDLPGDFPTGLVVFLGEGGPSVIGTVTNPDGSQIIPLPSSLALMLGALGVGFLVRRRARA